MSCAVLRSGILSFVPGKAPFVKKIGAFGRAPLGRDSAIAAPTVRWYTQERHSVALGGTIPGASGRRGAVMRIRRK